MGLSSEYRIDRGVAINASDIEPNPWNPNKTTERQQSAINESLDYYGQVLEVLVRQHPDEKGKYQIIDGEHRSNHLKDKVFVNIIHDLPDAEAKKLTIVLNETRGKADKVELVQLLESISTELGDDLMKGLPYSESELNELLKLAEVDWDNYSNEFNHEGSGEGEPPDNDLITIEATLSKEDFDNYWQGAYELVSENELLPKDKKIAAGIVLRQLAIDYLGRGN